MIVTFSYTISFKARSRSKLWKRLLVSSRSSVRQSVFTELDSDRLHFRENWHMACSLKFLDTFQFLYHRAGNIHVDLSTYTTDMVTTIITFKAIDKRRINLQDLVVT
jgi:predicted metal-dependent HD superfamily phosphohydrolase